MKTFKYTILLLVLLSIAASNSWAWWSASNIFSSTHYYLSDDARNLVDADHSDITRFGGDVRDWTSGITDDQRAHNGIALDNGGPIGDWWDFALDTYKEYDFNAGDWSAYYYVGLMMHLIEDQTVPAHAYDILHGSQGYPMDNCEELVFTNYHPDTVGIHAANNPTSNYAELITFTQNATSGSYWRQYWNMNAYGGPNETDVFPTWWVSTGTDERNLTSLLLGNAVGYTAGALVSVSESLPPLTKDLEITSTAACGTPTLSNQSSGNISFKISDNRSRTVKIFMTINGEPIISSEYGTGKYFDLSSGSTLPWEGTFSTTWNGKLANGSFPSDGEHALSVIVEDEDGNQSDVLQSPVSIDTTPPTISFSGAVDGGTYHSPVTITWSAIDNLDTNPYQTANYASGTTFTGSSQVIVTARDCAGNENTRSLSFSITAGTCDTHCASPGACSWHGGVNCSAGPDTDGSVICNDGWRNSGIQYQCY